MKETNMTKAQDMNKRYFSTSEDVFDYLKRHPKIEANIFDIIIASDVSIASEEHQLNTEERNKVFSISREAALKNENVWLTNDKLIQFIADKYKSKDRKLYELISCYDIRGILSYAETEVEL